MNLDRVLFNQLTDEQREAAVDSSREILCLACAGSGKSRTLAYRIAKLLAEGVPPESIVAFTFTEKAADSIKRRVSEALQSASLDPTTIGAMYIGTIHSYCHHILGDMDARYRQFDVLDDNKLKLYILSRYDQLQIHNFRMRRANNRQFVAINEIADAWKTANDEMLDYTDVTTEDEELGNLLFRLSSHLQNDQYIDFSLMIRNVVEILQTDVAPALAAVSSLKHLMVDEYQDINPCQEELIRLLHSRVDSLFVVGDDDQSIYAWRGADVSNILDFQNRYPQCSVHTLTENFRSTEPIVQASNDFAADMLGPSRISKNPSAVYNRSPQDFSVYWFPDRPAEAEWVIERIISLLGTAYEEADGTVRGLTPADFAILMRSTREPNRDGTPRHAAFTGELSLHDIPYSLEAGGAPFDRSQIAVLRDTFELLRNASIDRISLNDFYNNVILPVYPNAVFAELARVLADWSRRIHIPQGATRIRLYPQQLVYDLLEAFNISQSSFGEDVMRDIGLFSRMIMDVETVYMSVDSRRRFSEMLNFLQNAAESGYNVSTDDLIQRPDAVTVATVHKMKGLEFPCVFIVDVQAQRFPKRNRSYSGWLPSNLMQPAINRGAYQSTLPEEIRLFYTAVTRAERYLYISGAENLPGARRSAGRSRFTQQLLQYPNVNHEMQDVPNGVTSAQPQRRVEETDYPTHFSEIKYYLNCPKEYQFRHRFGLNPVIPEMFGFGQTVHTCIQKLHELYTANIPTEEEVEQVVHDTFHLKHVPQSTDPINRPGAYENSRNRADQISKDYVAAYQEDFTQERQVEVRFEIPATYSLISGSIDLLLKEDIEGNIVNAEIIEFKTMEAGDPPQMNEELDWTELSLQVQLYARAAEKVLGGNAKTGSVHLLKDNQRIEVPIGQDALDAAIANIEWAVEGILNSDFPMRPHIIKCDKCDFAKICQKMPQHFIRQALPPEIHLPEGNEMAKAFSLTTS